LTAGSQAALLIDFDNVTLGIRSDLQTQLRRLLDSEIIKGKVAVQRAYADWRRYPQYIVPLSEASIDLIFAPAFGSNKKNATDIRLAIDALELVFTRPEIRTFILLSGDSDFSSLVLKLKEYGKYVIGVGIRESSSDLLIQNCDEYFSYTELTGLTREGDTETVRHDPWELVVDAVTQMKRDDDVMRSDRLKQVMQSIDPSFDEHDAGFSRFSKFVVEAQARGLVKLEKMENGQFAVALGDNANVPLGREEEIRKSAVPAVPKEKPKPRPRRPARGGRRRPAASEDASLTLAEAFELLRQALMVLGAVEEEPAAADDARAKMIELFGDENDPIFQRSRFQRLLRQAHDADLIELAKGDGDAYQLRLGKGGMEAELSATAADVEAADSEPPATGVAPGPSEAQDVQVEATVHSGGDATQESSKKRSPRSRAATRRASKSRSREERPAPDTESKAPTSPSATETKPSATATAQPRADSPSPTSEAKPASGGRRRRNPRFRRGSRGTETAPSAPAPERAPDRETQEAPARSAPSPAPSTSGRREVGPRRGRRGRRGGGGTNSGRAEPQPQVKPTETPAVEQVSKASEAPVVAQEAKTMPERAEPADPKPSPEARGSL